MSETPLPECILSVSSYSTESGHLSMANGRSVQPYHELRAKNSRKGQKGLMGTVISVQQTSGRLVRAFLPSCRSTWRPLSVSFREHFHWLIWRRTTCYCSCDTDKDPVKSVRILSDAWWLHCNQNIEGRSSSEMQKNAGSSLSDASAAIPIG
jgi:hypothetical protein